MIEGLVSTIIPVHDRPRLLLKSVESVLGQSYEGIEIIIVDDGSSDSGMGQSLAVCVAKGGGRVKIIQQPNRGPGAARQRGLGEVTGEFIQFLDSDDVLLPDKFRTQVAALRKHPEADVAYGKTRYLKGTGSRGIAWKKTGVSLPVLLPHILTGRIWDTTTPLYRAEIVARVGGWQPLCNEEDWEFDCRLGAAGARLVWVDDWVSEQRAEADNRASAGGSTDPVKLRDRARARHLILGHALRAGIEPSTPEFSFFIRSSFLVARQCALAGLDGDARALVSRLHEVQPRAVTSAYLLIGSLMGLGRTTRVLEAIYRGCHRSANVNSP